MKYNTLYLSFLLVSTTLYASGATDLTWVDAQIQAIKPPRVGIQPNYIDLLKDPIRLIPSSVIAIEGVIQPQISSDNIDRTSHFKPLMLEAIMNQNAYISGAWYRIDDKVQNSILTSIEEDHVVLTEKNKKIRLFVNPENDKIKISKR